MFLETHFLGFFTPVSPKSLVYSTPQTTSSLTTPILVTTTYQEIIPVRELIVQETPTLLSSTSIKPDTRGKHDISSRVNFSQKLFFKFSFSSFMWFVLFVSIFLSAHTINPNRIPTKPTKLLPTCATTVYAPPTQLRSSTSFDSPSVLPSDRHKAFTINTRAPNSKPRIFDRTTSSKIEHSSKMSKDRSMHLPPPMSTTQTAQIRSSTNSKEKISAIPKENEEYEENRDKQEESLTKKEVDNVKDEVKTVRLASNTEPDELDQLWNELAKPTNKVVKQKISSTSQTVIYDHLQFQKNDPTEEISFKTLGTIPYNYDSEAEEKDNVYGDSGLPEGDAIDKPHLVTSKKSIFLQSPNNYATYTLSGFRSLAPFVGKDYRDKC